MTRPTATTKLHRIRNRIKLFRSQPAKTRNDVLDCVYDIVDILDGKWPLRSVTVAKLGKK